jgi:hypothetical protein
LLNPCWENLIEAMETPKAIKSLMPNHFSRKEGKFKKVREWFPLLEANFETHAITLDNEKMQMVQSLF